MENISVNNEDDIFTARNDLLHPSTSRIHFPSPLDATTSTRQGRQVPEYVQKSYAMPPVRRGSPLNPSQRRSRQSEGPPPDPPVLRQRRIPSPGILDIPDSDLEVGIFSNEYDLYPRILLDVQRALKLKARREARLKREHTASPPMATPFSNADSPPSASDPSRPKRRNGPSFPTSSPSSPTPLRKFSTSAVSDIDFSPSTGTFNIPMYSHPVPSSLDNGMTLDWFISFSDDDKADKRWPISIGKRRDKDKMFPLGVMAEQQEVMHKEKIDRIRTVASPQTHRKAGITREQLEKRYSLLYNSVPSTTSSFNLLKVVRWHSSLSDILKRSLEKAEPLTWLKHLDKPDGRSKRLAWHLSALMMEEYLQAKDPRAINNEDPSLQEATSFPKTYLTAPPPNMVLQEVSFQPYADVASKHLDVIDTNSGTDIPLSPLGPNIPVTRSKQFQPYIGNGAKSDNSSSNVSSSSYSDSAMPNKQEIINSGNQSDQGNMNETEMKLVASQDSLKHREELRNIPLQIKVSTSSKTSNSGHPVYTRQSLAVQPLFYARQNHMARRVRVSLPPTSSLGNKKHSEEKEATTRQEYETKVRLLEEAHAHNYRVRQMLNRISAAIREYDSIQSSSMKSAGKPQNLLPRELVDAFNHDPAAVTGATRKLRGWRAVEDIHQRLARQREIFRAFFLQSPVKPLACEPILHGPVAHLIKTLDVLETRKDDLVSTGNGLSELLQCVQRTHIDVKMGYNSTLSHTSILYPEIIALEENYRDQYQQFWDFGMDALTFLLDTVTPFWRTYGKTIGEDVRDFLIIPLYRNEFTGEAKRYRLKQVPRRSLRHWLGLVAFFVTSIGVNFLQARAALTSSLHCRLHWIPYDGVRWTALPFFWIGILIQWIAVVVEFAVVLMQLGVIAWWTGWSISIFH